jgi:hypothetical protein
MFDGILTELSCVGDLDHGKIHPPMSFHPAMVVHRGTKSIGTIGSQDRHRMSTRSSQILPRQSITSATEFFARRSPNFVHGGVGTGHGGGHCLVSLYPMPARWRIPPTPHGGSGVPYREQGSPSGAAARSPRADFGVSCSCV